MEEIDIIFSTTELLFVNKKVTIFRVIFRKPPEVTIFVSLTNTLNTVH